MERSLQLTGTTAVLDQKKKANSLETRTGVHELLMCNLRHLWLLCDGSSLVNLSHAL